MARKIAVSMGVTKQVARYEPIKFEAYYETDVADDVDIEKAYEDAWNIVDSELEQKLIEIAEAKESSE